MRGGRGDGGGGEAERDGDGWVEGIEDCWAGSLSIYQSCGVLGLTDMDFFFLGGVTGLRVCQNTILKG